jgi:hypothetical protein
MNISNVIFIMVITLRVGDEVLNFRRIIQAFRGDKLGHFSIYVRSSIYKALAKYQIKNAYVFET